MGKKIRRAAAGAALAGLLAAILLPGAAMARAASLRAETAARLSGQDDPESPLPSDSGGEEAAKFTAAVYGPAGSRCILTDAAGAALGIFRLDADGWGATPQLLPGTYGLSCENTALGSFTLLENAAISVADADGALWTDGEILYLSGESTGTVCVTVRLSAQAFEAALSGGLDAAFVLTLESETGQTQQRALGFYRGMAAADGWYSLCAEFSGLSAGNYTLSVSASGDTPAFSVSADGAPAALPAYVTLGGESWQTELVLELA